MVLFFKIQVGAAFEGAKNSTKISEDYGRLGLNPFTIKVGTQNSTKKSLYNYASNLCPTANCMSENCYVKRIINALYFYNYSAQKCRSQFCDLI